MAIDCVLCFRDDSGKYYINAYIALLSIFENTKEKIIVHILHDETIEHGRHDLESLCSSYGNEIKFHRVPDLDRENAAILSTRFNIGATYLYYAHELVAADTAVYLDCDVIFNRDIKDLADVQLGQRLFASTRDYSSYWKQGKINKKYKKTVERLGLSSDKYISSGLLVMNLKKLRSVSNGRNIFVKKTIDAITNGITLYYPDMDILNAVAAEYQDSTLILDDSFNLWRKSLHLGIDELEGKIFHFVIKPDDAFFPAHLLFWKYYAMSPFAGDMFERMSKAYTTKAMDFVKYYDLNPRQRRHAEELLQLGFLGMLKRAVGRKLGIIKK